VSAAGCGAAEASPLESRLGHRFADPAQLERALTHPSAAFEADGTRGNERLEFLGDAVLDLVVSRLLFEVHPGWPEGDLTRARAALVNTGSLAARARELGLDAEARLGRTEEPAGREKESILANLFEAVTGALYLDGGLAPVEGLVRRVFPEATDPAAEPPPRDPKTRLNEWAHARGSAPPRYATLEDRGEGGGERRFRAAVELEGERLAEGEGANKRAAERAAAEAALRGAEPAPRRGGAA